MVRDALRSPSDLDVEARAWHRLPRGTRPPIQHELPPRERAVAPPADLVPIVGHELRSSLLVMQVYGELAERDPAFVGKTLKAIRRHCRDMAVLIEDLLSASRVEAGQLVLVRQLIDLAPLVRECAEQAQALTSAHTISVTTPDGAVAGWWDPRRLEQIVNNLLTNATKYAPSGGEIAVVLQDLGDLVRLTVADNGLGIAAEELPRLFERCYRVHSNETAGIPGTGLGLYLTKALVEAHEGSIQVVSEPGRGSTFTVSLPRGVAAASRTDDVVDTKPVVSRLPVGQ